MKQHTSLLSLMIALGLLQGCGSSSGDLDPDSNGSSSTETGNSDTGNTDTDSSQSVDITNTVFSNRSGNCADYANRFSADVTDLQRSTAFDGSVLISATDNSCSFQSNNIPNHDFNDSSAHFATQVAEVQQTFTVSRTPALASNSTPLSQRIYNGIMLNGVPLDIKSAGCYKPNDPRADQDGNTAIGCNDADDWLLDPLSTEHKFGADAHNAHTQPNGSYHYHGDPNAMHDHHNPGSDGSPVIGFAADGFPIYGPYFYDKDSGQVRKAISGYTLKSGARPSGSDNPPGNYSGIYVDDWAFTNAGDLDACNGMTVDGQYGYYVTDTYPWIIACHSGTPHASFYK